MCFLRRRAPYGPHQGRRQRQHHPRPRLRQSGSQPRQTLRATSPAPSPCQSWEAILSRRPKSRGHAPRNQCHSYAKLSEHRLLRRLRASLGRLPWDDIRQHRGQGARRRRPRSDGHVDRGMTVTGKVPPLSLHKCAFPFSTHHAHGGTFLPTLGKRIRNSRGICAVPSWHFSAKCHCRGAAPLPVCSRAPSE